MKTLLLCLALAGPLLSAGLLPAPTARQDAADEGEDPIHDSMEVIEDALGRLRRAIRSTDTFPDALVAVNEMERATLRAKDLVPPMTAELPEAQRPAFVVDYRKMLIEMLEAELALETALLDGDLDATKAAFKRLRAFEDEGHERFMEEE
jgi:soluble cytochrome b562